MVQKKTKCPKLNLVKKTVYFANMSNINELLNNIQPSAMFYSGIDSDAFLVSIAAGGDVPYIAAWDKTGYRTYIMGNDEEYMPMSRETFIRLVESLDPLEKI
jgi:hypothetical protein